MSLGLRIENLYAFESNSKIFRQAVESLHNTYPLLKIYRGNIEEYASLQNTKFDIVYLDFTGTLIKEYKTLVKLLDMNALTDMSVLIVNTCYPDKTPENIDFLANFFYNDSFFELSVIDGFEREIHEDSWFNRSEGCDALGLDYDGIKEKIGANFEYAYSAFQTAFILDYANRHKPSFEVFKQRTLSDRLIQSPCLTKIKDFINKYYDVLLKEYSEDGQRLSSSQYLYEGFLGTNDMGTRMSRLDSMRIAEVFINSPYPHLVSDFSKIEKWTKQSPELREEMPDEEYQKVYFKDVLTDEVRQVLDDIKKWFHGQYKFCDMPMEHLWLELLLNQFGHPYHTNVGNHKRYSYKAKERAMCLDIITLDKCRALYDWMPMLEYFVHDMQDNNRQMITRMCMDAIDKQLFQIVDEVYYGSALVGINEFDWSRNKVLPCRKNIVVEGERQSSCKSLIIERCSQIANRVWNAFRSIWCMVK